MQYLELTLRTPAENLALDEALLLEAEAGYCGELLRIWELPALAVVLGSSGVVHDDVNLEACAADGVPILRRCSGGGTVLLGSGCLLFSLILSYDRAAALGDVTHSYAYILERVGRAVGAVRAGSSDLIVNGLKISGNSQRRVRAHLLHHGTILYDCDRSLIERYLHEPARQPEYRRGRQHSEFVANVALPQARIVAELREAWDAHDLLISWPSDLVRTLVIEKYSTKEWTWRR